MSEIEKNNNKTLHDDRSLDGNQTIDNNSSKKNEEKTNVEQGKQPITPPVKSTSSLTQGEMMNKQVSHDKSRAETLEYLMERLKYLGFPKNDYIKGKILEIMHSNKKGNFQHFAKNDSTFGYNNITYNIKINHSEKNDKFYFGGYDAKLENKGKDLLRSLSMTSSLNTYTAKEAINLLEGRMVKREFSNGAFAFVGIDFGSKKNEHGNHALKVVNQKDKIDVGASVSRSPLIIRNSDNYSKEEMKDFLIKSLEKGNLVKTVIDGKQLEINGFTTYDAQIGKLRFYDNDLKEIDENILRIPEDLKLSQRRENDDPDSPKIKR